MADALMDVQIIRNPFQNRVVSPDVAQNAMRSAYCGCGTAPVPARDQTAADGPTYASGLGNVRSGSILRAGRYKSGVGRVYQPQIVESGGADIRARAMNGALGRSIRGLGTLPCGTISDVATVTNTVASILGGTLSGEAGGYARMASRTITGATGTLCPPTAPPQVPAAPTSPQPGATSEAAAYQREMLQMMRDQQMAQTAQLQAKAAADAASAESNKTLYIVGGGAALLLIAVVLLK